MQDIQLSEHFKLSEFFVTEHNAPLMIKEFDALPEEKRTWITANLAKLCKKLEDVRVKNNKPMSTTSGWRSERVNRAAGGVKSSLHKEGKAADFPKRCFATGMTAWLYAHWEGGMGIYDWGIHLDIGPRKRW